MCMGIASPSRFHLMTSERCHRRGESSSIILETETTPQIEEGEEHEDSEELIVPFSGGPTDISLLWSFKTHVAADICNDDVRF